MIRADWTRQAAEDDAAGCSLDTAPSRRSSGNGDMLRPGCLPEHTVRCLAFSGGQYGLPLWMTLDNRGTDEMMSNMGVISASADLGLRTSFYNPRRKLLKPAEMEVY